MDTKLEKLSMIKDKMDKANNEELMSAFDRIIDILTFIKSICEDNTAENAVGDKLIELKNNNDYIYFKSIELVFIENTTSAVLPEILTNFLANSEASINDYITVLAFSSFTDHLRGDGYNKNLTNYLLSHFNVDFLKENWDYIEDKLNDFN